MAKSPSLKSLPSRGAATASELYSAVGEALSWWEGAEDALMGLFAVLCRVLEPTAFGSYVKAPRVVRSSMIELAMETHAARITIDENGKIREALKQLNRLASIRNEIAHGFVQHLTISIGSTVSAEGNYLLPSSNEHGPFERNVRFHHDAASIKAFEENVRDARWSIIVVTRDIEQREQSADLAAGPDAMMHLRDALAIAWRKIPIADAGRIMRSFEERRAARDRAD